MDRNKKMENRAGRWWAVAILAGLIVAGTIVVSASTASPSVGQFYKRLLAEDTKFTAYPDIAVGEGGLVVSVWTEGSGSVADKHLGPVMLGWISDSAVGWETLTIDSSIATEAVVAVAGTTAHVVWIKDDTPWPKGIYYNSCDLSQAVPSCTSKELVAEGGQPGTSSKVSQVSMALDQSGTIHAVWSEGDLRGLYYSSKSTGQTWTSKGLVWDEDVFTTEGYVNDFSAMAVNHIGDDDYVHLVWAQEIATLDSTYHIAKYCRRDVIGGFWGECAVLADKVVGNDYYPARNLSIAADGKGNVYAVWDLLVDHNPSKREYVIGYRHSPNNGLSWRAIGTYPKGNDIGFQAKIFRSGEDASVPAPTTGEYAHFLRPRISLATSGTLTTPVPVLAWHAQILPRGSVPELAQLGDEPVHKVFWTYATKPGSNDFGSPFWASDYITLSTDFCGELEMNVNSTTVNLAIVGDLNNVKDGGQPAGPDRLHAVFHEEIGEDVWGVYYTGNVTVSCFRVYLPLVFQRYNSGGRR